MWYDVFIDWKKDRLYGLVELDRTIFAGLVIVNFLFNLSVYVMRIFVFVTWTGNCACGVDTGKREGSGEESYLLITIVDNFVFCACDIDKYCVC